MLSGWSSNFSSSVNVGFTPSAIYGDRNIPLRLHTRSQHYRADMHPQIQTGLQTTHTQTHPFSGPFSGTIQVNRYQKSKTTLDFTEARDSEWQWHQLGHMQVCTLLQTDNHPAPHHSVFYRPDTLPATQPTVTKH